MKAKLPSNFTSVGYLRLRLLSRLGSGLEIELCLVILDSIMFRFRFIVLHYFRSTADTRSMLRDCPLF